ncbi:MAG: NAD(P)H-dependent oxidoreductase subunit E, partial [Planctomycetota bacterium]
MGSEIDLHEIDKIATKYQGDQGPLIQVLLDVQNAYNWLPEAALRRISERLGIAFS